MRPAGRRRRWALGLSALAGAAGLVVLSAPAPVAAASAAQALPPLPGPCDLPLVGTLCDVPDALGGAVDAVAGLPGEVANAAVEAFAQWVASGAAGFVATAGQAIFAGTQPDLTGAGEGRRAWFLERYADMALVSLGLFVPLLILAVLHGVVTSSPGLVWRAVANLPVATLGTAASVVVVQALLGATDAASTFVARSLQSDTGNALSGVVAALTQQAAVGGGASLFGAVLLALFMAVTAFVVWLELVVREAAVYLTVAFLPLGFATYIWPALSSWLRRLIEVIVALVLSKLVIVVALSMAGSALAAQEGFAALVAGAGMLLLAAFAPFALFKLIPVASMATMSSLEGQGRRAARASTPRMSSVFYARQLSGAAGRGRSGSGPGAGAGTGGGQVAPSGGAASAAAGPAAPAVAAGASGARMAGGAVRRAGGAAATNGSAAGPSPSGGSGRAAPDRAAPPPDVAKPAAPPLDFDGEGPA